jgi:hypothetical protein
VGDIAPYFLTLAYRNNPICVTLPKVAKASKECDIAMRYRGHFKVQILPMLMIHKYCPNEWHYETENFKHL